MDITEFQNKIEYSFRDSVLLEKALTHSSYCREHGIPHEACNERLEFLGDAYLDAVISEYLYNHMPKNPEGSLTKYRAQIVCEQSLADIGRRLEIGQLLRMGKGETKTGGRNRPSIIADAVEAVIGAIYLDGSYQAVENFVLREFADTIRRAVAGQLFADYKTQVQEVLQKDGTAPVIRYVLDRTEGPDHCKSYTVACFIDGKEMSIATARSIKLAEKAAAEKALAALGEK
jgi:ribonuclease-3